MDEALAIKALLESSPGIGLAVLIWWQARADLKAAREALADHVTRMDVRDQKMLDIVTANTAVLQGIGGTLAQLASIERLEGIIREDARERRGGHA